jgi:DNA-binding NarL/FixJ family response regulator
MKASKKSPTYSPEQSRLLSDRLFALHANLLSHVKSQLAQKQARKGTSQPAALTGREQQVAALVGRGVSNKKIAHQLGLSEGTVKIHTHHIYRKLGVKTRCELIYAMSLH